MRSRARRPELGGAGRRTRRSPTRDFVPCGRRPLAVVLDIDETALLNLGYEYDDATHPGRPYDQQRWNALGADRRRRGRAGSRRRDGARPPSAAPA